MRRIGGQTSGIHLCKMELGTLGEQPKMHLTVGRTTWPLETLRLGRAAPEISQKRENLG